MGMILLNSIMILNLNTFNKMLTHLKSIMIRKPHQATKLKLKSEDAYTIVQATSHTESIKSKL